MTFNLGSINELITLLGAWGAAFLTALWLSLIYWTYRDAKERMSDPVLRFLSVLMTVAFFIPGVLIYLILRPRYTLDEEYLRTLEEEALLRSIEDKAREQDK
ncbi:MAG: hypothetical protein DWG76_04195 [Chloroflexi bacterium]|nr:hypothetical protein [Chloroflexota bacterium]MQC26637.1 hypothetical protein [Chloroflexota bacterium]